MVQELAPSAHLAPHVDALWLSSGSRASRVLPDGCADILFDLDAASATVVGTMTRPLIVESPGNLLGVRFRPGHAAAFVGVPLSELTDARIPLRDLGILASRVSEARANDERIALVQSALARDVDVERRVIGAIDLIVASGGRARLEKICDDVGISRQHLARLFAHHVGITPKTFARVVRFRRALRLARDSRLADLAPELGYFDQSHLIGEFREFAGDTPVPFFQSRTPAEP